MAPPTVSDTLSSALEGLAALILCAVTAAWTSSSIRTALVLPGPWYEPATGAVRLVATAALFAVLYGRRFFHTLGSLSASWRVIRW